MQQHYYNSFDDGIIAITNSVCGFWDFVYHNHNTFTLITYCELCTKLPKCIKIKNEGQTQSKSIITLILSMHNCILNSESYI